jgi:hypothetical protein
MNNLKSVYMPCLFRQLRQLTGSGELTAGIQVPTLTVLNTIMLPIAVILSDVSSDGWVLYGMLSFASALSAAELEGAEPDVIVGIAVVSSIILLLSLVSLLWHSPLPSLLRGVRTEVAMASREQERADVLIPLGGGYPHTGSTLSVSYLKNQLSVCSSVRVFVR